MQDLSELALGTATSPKVTSTPGLDHHRADLHQLSRSVVNASARPPGGQSQSSHEVGQWIKRAAPLRIKQ